MKITAAIFLILSVAFFSCYDNGSEFSRVLLLIDTPPTVNIDKLYAGVFLGAVSPQTLITKVSFTPSNI